MEYDLVIGLEVHTQLLTRSKMFCRCSARYSNAEPNTHVCPICLGMPGTLPVINEQAVEFAVMAGLALNCEIAEFSKFDRKNYPYPDLMKGYQISQYDLPICKNGWLMVNVAGVDRTLGITRAHMEEDTARLLHRRGDDGQAYTLMDINRAGVPLLEIVGEPDIRAPEEARAYLQKLRTIVVTIGISDGRMDEGSFRCDANISLRPRGATEFGTKVEVKNMNSFKSVQRALEFEAKRQAALLDRGERIPMETRGWVEERGVTVSQRSKEEANDYRYFPEPDLPPLMPDRAFIEMVRAKMPELPDAKRDRFIRDYGLRPDIAEQITDSVEYAGWYEAAMAAGSGTPARAKVTADWLVGDFTRLLNASGTALDDAKVTPAHLAGLLDLVENATISGKIAKDVFEAMFTTGQLPGEIVTERGLVQITDETVLRDAVDRAIAANPQSVADYLNGKEKALVFLVGHVMKETRGKANPARVNELLRERLAASRA